MTTKRKRNVYFRANTKAHDIISLWRDGVKSASEIARRLDCTAANVIKTLHRHVPEYVPHKKRAIIKVASLSDDHIRWLKEEARSHGIEIEQMAGAMLVDAIEEARKS